MNRKSMCYYDDFSNYVGKYECCFKELSQIERRSLILELSSDKTKTYEQSTILNDLVIFESKKLLKKIGSPFNVSSPNRKDCCKEQGICYANAAEKMSQENIGYVEGIVQSKKMPGIIVAHAWNVEKNGSHIDYTYEFPEDYNYYGVIIPTKIVFEVGSENGFIWYAVLPFIDNL